MKGKQKDCLRVAFCHPDLGLGGECSDGCWNDQAHKGRCFGQAEQTGSGGAYAGAERLVVDAAAELAGHGHTVG